ncbi:MAG: TIGR03560 family F420-dependent LLM class oxidoreductase [Dehalococcoidia bacterium]|nr:TIGR03560 family F420-dependent LLM class oxidoreductase [Dehalococcoidia bacterium]
MAPKVRIGIQTGLDNVEWRDVLAFWRFLDRETAFDNVWTFDHFVPPIGATDPSGTCLEGWTALAAAAQATERLRVGCLVTGVTYRHPSVLAKMAATVDHISNGRLEFGIGAAWHEPEHRVYGVPFPSVRERSDMLEEAVQLIKLLFQAEGPVDFQGRHYQLRQAPFAPPCVQKPHPPIFVGGGGEQRTLRTAARYADAMNVLGGLDTVKEKIAALERHCADAGRDPSEITKSTFGPIMLVDEAGAAEKLRERLAGMAGTTPERAAETLPVGDAAHIRGVIERFAEAGVSYMIMMSRPPYNFDLYRRISDDVVAAFA